MTDRIGQLLGHYRLTSFLGHGGFAEVYLGEHLHLGTQAAIKILGTRLAHSEIEQFRNEARIIASLEHPHIVRVLDFDVEDQVPFLIMSYAPNGTLRHLYPKGSCMSQSTVLFYVKQLAAALQYAHDRRLIHRDVKPENMLLGRNNEALLSDFGLAVVVQSSSYEGPRDMAGTIAYMAPEQTRGKPRPASDQYALGIVVYEWLCGMRPFDGSYEEIAVQQVLTPPRPLREIVPTLSEALEEVVMRALAKDPHERYASVQDFANAFEQVCHAEQITVIPPPFTVSSLKSATPSSHTTERTPSDTTYAVAWSPDKHYIVSGGSERMVQVWKATTGTRSYIYHGHTGRITAVGWSPDGTHIASASLDRTIQVWHASSGQKLSSYSAHSGMVYAVSWSPNSTFLASVSSGADNTVNVWEAASGQNLSLYRGHTYWARAVAWSPDGKSIASGSFHEVHIWDVVTARKLATYRGHESWVRAVAWSPDGKSIASAGEDKVVHVWEPNKGRDLAIHRGHNDWIGIVLWSPDGKRIASASRDNVVHIWDASSGGNCLNYRGSASSAYAIAWLPDGKHVVFTNGEGSVQVWQA